MQKNKLLIMFNLFILLTFTSAICGAQQINAVAPQKLSLDLSDELSELFGFQFAQIVFVDSRNGKKVLLMNQHAEEGKISDSFVLRKISSITIAGVTGIKGYEFCNYINIDARTDLICRQINQDSRSSAGDKFIPDELARKLENVLATVSEADDFKIGFILASNVENGQFEILRHSEYSFINSSLPMTVSEITNNSSWSVITKKINPCCQDVYINGSWVRICDKSVPSC